MSLVEKALRSLDIENLPPDWKEDTKHLPYKLALISALMRKTIGTDEMREQVADIVETLFEEEGDRESETISQKFQNYINRRV